MYIHRESYKQAEETNIYQLEACGLRTEALRAT